MRDPQGRFSAFLALFSKLKTKTSARFLPQEYKGVTMPLNERLYLAISKQQTKEE